MRIKNGIVDRLTGFRCTGRALLKGKRLLRAGLGGIETALVLAMDFDQHDRSGFSFPFDDMAEERDLTAMFDPNVVRDDHAPVDFFAVRSKSRHDTDDRDYQYRDKEGSEPEHAAILTGVQICAFDLGQPAAEASASCVFQVRRVIHERRRRLASSCIRVKDSKPDGGVGIAQGDPKNA